MTEPITLELALHIDNENHSSIAVSEDGDVAKMKWLPRTKIEYREIGCRFVKSPGGIRRQVIEITMPAWLAVDRGLA